MLQHYRWAAPLPLYRSHRRHLSSSIRCQRQLKFSPVDAPTRYVQPINRKQKRSIKRRDRVAGRLSAKTGGARLPFRETEWGRRRKRQLKIREKAEEHVEQLIADEDQREAKTQLSETLTAALPALTAGDVEDVYLSLMAPSTSTPAALPSSTLALEAPAPSDLFDLQRRLLPSTDTASTSLVVSPSQRLERCVAALEEEVVAVEATRQALGLSARQQEKLPDAGLATSGEWRALIAEAVQHASPEMSFRLLHLMQRSGVEIDSSLLKATIGMYAEQANVVGAEHLLAMLIEARLPVDEHVHEAVLRAHIKNGDTVNAQFYLRALEQRSITPTEAAYQLVIEALFTARQASPAWDLFAHCRLVAHPTPSPALYARMIRACAETASHKGVSPERAFDLREEMKDNAIEFGAEHYAALILACMRSGRAEYYIKGLNLLREMLNAGHRAEKGVMDIVLEGASRQGDLARARWVFLQMLQAAEAGDVANAPTAKSLVSLLQAHAKVETGGVKVMRAESSEVATIEEAVEIEGKEEEEPLSFPGPMPRTKQEVLKSARLLMERYARRIGVPDFLSKPRIDEVDSYLSTHCQSVRFEPPYETADVGFSQMMPSHEVLDAYLYVMRERSSLLQTYALYRTMYAQFGWKPTDGAVATIMQAFLSKRKHPEALEMASTVFAGYAERLGPNALTKTPGDGSMALAPWSAFTSRIWSCIIQMLATKGQLKPSLQLATQFTVLYPPSLTTRHARAVKLAERRVPAAEVRLASPDYPETSSYHASARPPSLDHQQVKILDMLLTTRSANEGKRWLRGMLDQYARAKSFGEAIIRGNDALPDADRGPAGLIGKQLPRPGQVSLLGGTGPEEEARRAMFEGFDVHFEDVDHPSSLAIPPPVRPLRRIVSSDQRRKRELPSE